MNMDSDDGFDDEIIEIFVEEVDEVLEQIDAQFPKWHKNVSDHTALKEIRRAFHTLKGSGRMVQADEIGELSWSVENMLNRVLDGSLPVNDAIYELVEEVRRVIPTLLKAFEKKQAAALAGVNISRLMEQADALREGKEVASLHDYAHPEPAEAAEVDAFTPGLTQTDSQIDDGALLEIHEQLGELFNRLDEQKRSWVKLGSQVDALKTQLGLLPKSLDADEISRQLQTAEKEIKELKYFIKASSEQMMGNFNETQQRMVGRIDEELRIVNDVAEQVRMDNEAAGKLLRTELKNQIRLWSLGSSVALSVLVLLIVVLIL